MDSTVHNATLYNTTRNETYMWNLHLIYVPILLGMVVSLLVFAWSGFFVYLLCYRRNKSDFDPEDTHQLLSSAAVGENNTQLAYVSSVLDTFDMVERLSWFEFYVDVKMKARYSAIVSIKPNSKEKMLGYYTEMFKMAKDPKITMSIYLEGAAGTGKTTLTKRILVDWCHVIKAETLKVKIKIPGDIYNTLKEFKYILPVFLRETMAGDNFTDAIARSLKMDTELVSRLLDDALSGEGRTLIILDGYDDYQEVTSDVITQFAKRQDMQNIDLMVTSRYLPSKHFENATDIFSSRFRILGFSEKGAASYINKFFHNKPTGKMLFTEIKKSDDAVELRKYPALLLWMCIVWRDHQKSPGTATDFCQEYLAYILSRFEENHIGRSERHNYENIVQSYENDIMEIGGVAVEGMAGHRFEQMFPIKAVDNLGTRARNIGLLNKVSGTSVKDLVCFHHKIFQEFFASIYLTQCSDSRRQELFEAFRETSRALKETEMLLKFIAEFGENELAITLADIMTAGVVAKTTEPSSQLSVLSESKTAKCTLPGSIDLTLEKKYKVQLLRRYLSMDAKCLRELTIRMPELGLIRLLQSLFAPALKVLRLFPSDIAYPVSQKQLQNMHPQPGLILDELCITGFKRISMDDADAVGDTLKDTVSFKMDQIGFIEEDAMISLSSWLKRSRKVKEIRVTNSGGVVAVEMVACSKENPSLEKIDFSGTMIHEAQFYQALVDVRFLHQVAELSLRRCESVHSIVRGHLIKHGTLKYVLKSEHLKVLDLYGHRTVKNVYLEIGRQLCNLPLLQQLSLPDLDIVYQRTCSAFVENIHHVSKLEVLEFGRLSLDSVDLKQLGEKFSSCDLQLLHLNISGACSVRSGEFSELLGNLPTSLQILDLSQNAIGTEDLRHWTRTTSQLTNLHTLNMAGCSLSDEETVTELVTGLTALKDLDLSKNNLEDKIKSLNVASVNI